MMNVIPLSASDFPIKSVKIFSSRRAKLADVAEVTRVFPLDFTQSSALNESLAIEISNLPLLSPHSGIRVSVTSDSDDLLVTDYYHDSPDHKLNLFGHRGEIDPGSSHVLRDLQAEFTRLVDERQLKQQSFAFLSAYINSVAKGDALGGVVQPAQLAAFFDEFVDIGKSQSEVIVALDQQITDVQQKIDKEIRRLLLESRSLATKATVILAPVSGRTATTAELELKYRVKATWKPVYEIHVATIDSVPSSSVVLTYQCQISQSTGENWDNVELAVTTADLYVPSAGLPEPKKIVMRLQGFIPECSHQPAVKPQVTPLWQTPGYASPFRNILSSTQQVNQCMFGSPQSVPHQADPSQDSTRAAQGPAASVFGAFQGQATTTTQGFGSAFSHLPTQSQASSSTIVPPSSTAWNSSVSSLGGSIATEDTLSFKQRLATPDLKQSQPSTSLFASVQPSSWQHQRERAVLAEFDEAVTHTATAKAFIPSRTADVTNHVLIANIPLNASFTRVAVPSVDNRVFWTCEVLNTSNYVLTPGTIHTYLDGRHVSDSEITSVNQPQTIQCSLGIDPAVTTQFNRTVDSKSDFGVLDGKATTKYTITTTIKNTHHDPVSNVIVRASLPLPGDSRVTVALQEPEGLAAIDSGMVWVGDGCHARWSTTENRAGKNDGLFEWVCSSVKPGSQVLKAVWEVTMPRGLSFTEQ